MRQFGTIQHIKNRYYLYIRGKYVGSFKNLEEAERARESMKETYEPVEIGVYLPLFAERLNMAIGQRSVISVCKQASVSKTCISRYLNGESPSVKSLMSLALALNVSTDWLLGISQKPI